MLSKPKVRAAVIASLACASLSATAALANAGADHGARPRVRSLDARSESVLLAHCRAEKISGVAGSDCASLSTSEAGVDPTSTPALSALLQQCLAAKAGQPGAPSAACTTLDHASGN
jgi:hypothetical protein